MTVTSNRSVTITWTGDVEYSQVFDASVNEDGSGNSYLVDLSSGNNSITIPSSAIAVTIIKPSDNTVALIAKGVNGDTGIILSLTDPDSFSLGDSATLVLNAASALTGLRLIFS